MTITHKRGVVDFNLSSYHFDIKRRILGGCNIILHTGDTSTKKYHFVCDTYEHSEGFIADFIRQMSASSYNRDPNITELQNKYHVMLIGA